MGLMNESKFEGSAIGIAFCGVVATGAVLRVFFHIASAVEKENAQCADEDDVVCTCISKRCTPWLLTLYCNLTAVACYFVSVTLALISPILYFSVCDDCPLRKALWNLKILFMIFGCTMLFVSHFERLRLTFIGSNMELPKWAPKVMRALLLLFVVFFGSTVGFRHSQPALAGLCAVLTLFLYFAAIYVLIRAFFEKTLAAANTTPPDTVLLEMAVRMTIVVTVSLLSTTLAFVFWVVIFGTCQMCYFWMALGNAVIFADLCLNAFCLMCTFSSSLNAYMRVFGAMHASFLARLRRRRSRPSRKVKFVRKSKRVPTAASVTAATVSEDQSQDPDTVVNEKLLSA